MKTLYLVEQAQKELPFEKKGNEIYYRGEPVNTIPDTHKYFSEHSYRDIGFGMKEKEGEIVSTRHLILL